MKNNWNEINYYLELAWDKRSDHLNRQACFIELPSICIL